MKLPKDPTAALVRMAQNGMHFSLAPSLERQVKEKVEAIVAERLAIVEAALDDTTGTHADAVTRAYAALETAKNLSAVSDGKGEV